MNEREIPYSLTYPAIVATGVPFDDAARISDAIQGILAPSAPEPGKTVRVRIAVAVDEHGNWDAGEDGDAAAEWLMGRGALSISHSWVEADVPLPLAPRTVQGSVTSAQEG